MKPRLTQAMIKKLKQVAMLAAADAEAMLDDQKKEAREVLEATEWIWQLCRWYDEQKKRKAQK